MVTNSELGRQFAYRERRSLLQVKRKFKDSRGDLFTPMEVKRLQFYRWIRRRKKEKLVPKTPVATVIEEINYDKLNTFPLAQQAAIYSMTLPNANGRLRQYEDFEEVMTEQGAALRIPETPGYTGISFDGETISFTDIAREAKSAYLESTCARTQLRRAYEQITRLLIAASAKTYLHELKAKTKLSREKTVNAILNLQEGNCPLSIFLQTDDLFTENDRRTAITEYRLNNDNDFVQIDGARIIYTQEDLPPTISANIKGDQSALTLKERKKIQLFLEVAQLFIAEKNKEFALKQSVS